VEIQTPIRDWIESLEPADRETMLEASVNDWVLLGALAVALGPVGTAAAAEELRAAFLYALVEHLRVAEGSAGAREAVWLALEVAAVEAVFGACDENGEAGDCRLA
jgi:hypothetical protein